MTTLYLRLKESRFTILLAILMLVGVIAVVLIINTYTLGQIKQMLCMGIYPTQTSNFIPSFCYGSA